MNTYFIYENIHINTHVYSLFMMQTKQLNTYAPSALFLEDWDDERAMC